ncbi:uncharacterized protein LOC135351893 [Halichondria panicea]|uniref:uncharacterized protein LOC135351893 n=1 Tax=Halichondria panicea TaxID=6063 RepID=UPI00312B3F45
MTSTAVWVMLVCILQTSQVLCQGNVCREPLITGEKYRVEDEQITASSIFSEDYPPHKARLGGMEWCAQEGLGIGAWIQVDFRENVIIQELQIEGDGGEFQYYLTQFTIEYGPNSDQLSSILQPNSTDPMVFTRPDSPDVSTTVLPNPLTTRILRIVGVAFFGGAVLCLDLEAIGCVLPPVCREPLITGEKYRVEDEQITASSIFSEDYPPHKARLGGMEWCAQEGLGIGAWIQVDFRENIIIQELQIEGDGGEFQYYLTQFTIEYGPNSDQLSSILQPNSFQPMVFTRPDSPSVSTTVLPNPLTTQILRIVGVAFFGGAVLCLDLEAIGCVLPLDATTTDTTQITSTNFPQRTDDTMTGNTGAIVGGSVGGATFVLVILNVTIIILVCLLVKRNKGRNIRTEATTGSNTVQIAENETNSEETRAPNTLENMGEVYSEPTAIAYEPIAITTLNPPNMYTQANTINNVEERDGDMTQYIAFGKLVENGATSLPETEDGYELVWL